MVQAHSFMAMYIPGAKSGATITIVPHTIESTLIPNCFTE